MDYPTPLLTIVELPEYERRASKLLTATESRAVIEYLAAHPQAGVLMRGTGGIRKLRWATGGGGKSGGARIIYYFHNRSMPLFLLTLFGKNEKTNLSQQERNDLSKLTGLLVKNYG